MYPLYEPSLSPVPPTDSDETVQNPGTSVPAASTGEHPTVEITDTLLERLRLKLRYKVLYHVGHSCPDVDDLVQETLTRFIRASQKHTIRNTEELGGFLNGVCRNAILEFRRRSRREPLADEDGDIPEVGVRPDAEIMVLRDAIDTGLAELADRDRAVLRALYLEGKDKDEICRDWNMSDQQFRVVLFRAKERFRRAYTGEVKQNATPRH